MKKLSVKNSSQSRLLLLLILINAVAFCVLVLLFDNRDILIQIFNEKLGDSYKNFFRALNFSKGNAAYDNSSAIDYTPFCLAVSKIINLFIPNRASYNKVARYAAAQSGRMAYIIFVIICVVIIWSCILAFKTSKSKKAIVLFTVVFSFPMLYAIGFGTFALVAAALSLVFVVFYDNDNRFLSEVAIVSLAAAGAIKIYPIAFLLFLFNRKHYKKAIRTLIYFIILFCVPYMYFKNCPDIITLIIHMGGERQRRDRFNRSEIICIKQS